MAARSGSRPGSSMRSRLACPCAGAAIAVALTGCAILDPSQPIGVVTRDLDPGDAAALEAAAGCWTDTFGIDFRFGADADTADQFIEAVYNDQTCLYHVPAQD